MQHLNKLLLISTFTLLSFQLSAIPAIPYPVKITQPDGSQITVILRGDERSHYRTTTDGYPLVKNEKGIFNYAKISQNGQFIDTQIKASDIHERTVVEKSFLNSIQQEKETFIHTLQKKVRRAAAAHRVMQSPAKFPKNGAPHSLVILVNFSNLAFVVPNPNMAFNNLLNEQNYSANGGTGSAKDYFRDNSMGTFNPTFDVVGPFTLPQNYAFYGANDPNNDNQDTNPTQMVIDACALAAQSGVNFGQYDVDNDGFVDNVFVYYAGYNEAENAPEGTVWPHRWQVIPGNNYTGTVASTTFNGKRVKDYACTSELKGRAGSNMCGIGTFCHEFGHVLGLVDFYPTNGNEHHTLSSWDIMDGGPYLNQGRTPPAYSSHERFFLGWMTPTELKNPVNAMLPPLTTSNQAYIITQNGNHNLNGANPQPREFFMLENRQQIGWDRFLKGHGLLITRIYYDPVTWNDNGPNNDPANMGVDIMEADGIGSDATLGGDPFPGTSNIREYTPTLRSGTVVNKPLTYIEEINNNNNIYFKFMGGADVVTPPKVFPIEKITDRSFTVKWESTSSFTAGYYLTVYMLDNNGNKTIIKDRYATTKTTEILYNLISNKDYYVYLEAFDKDGKISLPSETLIVHTLPYTSEKELRVTAYNGTVEVFVPTKTSIINVYNIIGQRIMSLTAAGKDILHITNLQKGQVYILQSDKLRAKIML